MPHTSPFSLLSKTPVLCTVIVVSTLASPTVASANTTHLFPETQASLAISTERSAAPTPPTLIDSTLGDSDGSVLSQAITNPASRALNNSCSTSLPRMVQKVLNRPQVAAQGWGVVVASLNQDTVLFSHKPNSFFIPASNTKIFTTAAALQRLGPAHRIGSKSLAEWVNVVNTYSNNNSANILLRNVGGPSAVQRTLSKIGIDPKHFRQRDGSGLSRGNRATPNILVAALKSMSRSDNWAYFYHSLPSGGESGTLKRRFKAPAVKGKVRAKTGTLRGVRALSGYLNHRKYGPLVFSILVNQRSQPGSVLVKNIDSMVLNMALSRPCGRDAALFQ